jgi:YVTN family beta-propeller protein
MKWTTGLSLATLAGAAMLLGSIGRSNAQIAETSPLVLENKIVLGEVKGRIDHMAFDPARNRLFVAELENNSVGIVDVNDRKVVHVIKGLTEPQGIGHDQLTDTLYVANGGDGSVRMFRGADYSEIGRIALGDDADNIRIDPDTRHLLVGYGSGGIATIDPTTRSKIADFRLPAHPEGFQLDRKNNQILVNVPHGRAIAVLDGGNGQQKALWRNKESGANFPMALDEDAQRVLIAFRSPGRLAVYSTHDGQSVATADVCGDADDLFVDAKRSRIYVSCGEGFLDIIDARATDYRRIARLATVRGARTSYYAPLLDRLFLAVRAASLEPAAVWVYKPVP